VMLVFCATWAMDAAAYLAGRRWGHHHLAPKVSPAKTVEGAGFGLIASILITLIFLYLALPLQVHPLAAGVIGLVLGMAGEAGDLLESRFKRWVGAKDSGDVIPGHGGVLDRFDSLMLAAPVLYLVLVLAY
jgi:phosphatidate cytidylyltransferase